MSSVKLVGALGLSLLVAGATGVAVGAGSSAHTPPLVHGVNFQIKTVVDETFCVDTNGETQSSGPSVYLAKCNGHETQRWTFTDGADGTGVVVGSRGMCLSINHSVATSPAQIASCTYATNQRFTVTAAGEIIEVRSGKCLTTSTAAAEQDPVFLTTCSAKVQKTQHWQITL
jgi:hypothetical protein